MVRITHVSAQFAFDGHKIVNLIQGSVLELSQVHEAQIVNAGWAEYVTENQGSIPGKPTPAPPPGQAAPVPAPGPAPAPPTEENREVLEERYRNLGGRPSSDWSLAELKRRLDDRIKKQTKTG